MSAALMVTRIKCVVCLVIRLVTCNALVVCC